MKRLVFLLMILALPAWSKPLVVASFSILGDMVHEIGRDKIDLKVLVGPNQDSHIFEPRPQHAKDLSRADLVVVNGLGFEGWMDRLIKASGFKGSVLVATQGVSPLTQGEEGMERLDPHAWHSLKNALIYVDNIVDGLSKLVPEEAAFFKAQGKAYKKRLQELEKKTGKALAALSSDERKVLTNHDAFEYLGHQFNIMFFSPLGMSTDAEPSAKVVADLIQRIKKDDIQAVFIENISNPRLVEQIAEETGTHVGGVLYSDALDVSGSEADTYLKMMEFNLDALVRALHKK